MLTLGTDLLKLAASTEDFLNNNGYTVICAFALFIVLSFINTVMMQKGESKNSSNDQETQPQPKWLYLRIMNYVVLGLFIGTIVMGISHFQAHDDEASPKPFPTVVVMMLTACLAYFWGFFGISFTDTESILSAGAVVTNDSQGTNDLGRKEVPSSGAKTIIPNKALHDGPICSDKKNVVPVTVTHTAYEDVSDFDYNTASDEAVLELLVSGALKDYQLEKKLGDHSRAVVLRRLLYEQVLDKKLELIPHADYDYGKVFGANCEIVIGFVPLPLGIVGPLLLNNENVYVPMATTEGCLVASTNRGCKAISACGGCSSVLLKDAITRAPCLRFPTAVRAAECKKWVENAENYALLRTAFNSTTNFGKLASLEATVAGRNCYLRFNCMSGDAMGMNMVSKGCLKTIEVLEEIFPDLVLIAISGNMCTDKKPSAINWILGRGKSIVVEAIISDFVVRTVLKSSVKSMIETNTQKNLIGSAMAGSIGGFNAHAANIVTAVFLATGQDPAQNVESSNCLTIMEYAEDGESLHVSVTMPSVEVGTVGGGTHLPAQAGCLDICGVRGAAKFVGSSPGDNSRKLAQIVGASVLAGELSLMAALAANHLVRSHMQHNRKQPTPVVENAASAEAAINRTASMPDMTAFSKPTAST